MIIGWSLINSVVKTEHYVKMQAQIVDLKKNKLIPMNAKVALGQKFLADPYRGKGIVELMTDIQDAITAHKYDLYLATVQKTNKPSEFFLKKNSFQLIYEDDIRYYFTKEIIFRNLQHTQSLNISISNQNIEIVIRQGRKGDGIALHQLNKQWTRESKMGEFDKGFLTSLYSPDEFERIIEVQEIVIAEIN